MTQKLKATLLVMMPLVKRVLESCISLLLLVFLVNTPAGADSASELRDAEYEYSRLESVLRDLKREGRSHESSFQSACPDPRRWTASCQSALNATAGPTRQINIKVREVESQLETVGSRVSELRRRVESESREDSQVRIPTDRKSPQSQLEAIKRESEAAQQTPDIEDARRRAGSGTSTATRAPSVVDARNPGLYKYVNVPESKRTEGIRKALQRRDDARSEAQALAELLQKDDLSPERRKRFEARRNKRILEARNDDLKIRSLLTKKKGLKIKKPPPLPPR